MAKTEHLTVSSVLPPYLRASIPFEIFNRMQSNCLEAWNNDANLLISSPTGSGKTVIFELAILRHVHRVLEFSVKKHLGSKGLTGKIVFIAPTKAICQEKQDDWRKRFSSIGLRVEAVTGDIGPYSSRSRLNNADLILTTPEKWDSVTRNNGSHSPTDLTGQLSLLLLDEVHQIGDARGATFESVVTRMLVTSDESKYLASSSAIAKLRVIAVSATISNTQDIGQWLRVERHHIKEFDASYRPVSLEYKIFGFSIKNRWQSAKVYDSETLHVIRELGDRKPALVFSPSRRQTAISAKALVENLDRSTKDVVTRGNILTRHLSVEQRRRLFDCSTICHDKVLASLLPSGVAIHNAEMNHQNRRLVEDLFRESLIQCLFSTSTLAQGVNLPARLVVIAGTAVYHGGELREYNRNMLLQMCGRAGRPGLDTKGVVAIMTSRSNVRLYQNIHNSAPAVLESQLVSGIQECFNAEIARQFVTDVPTAVAYLTKTFFWARERQKIIEMTSKRDFLSSEATSMVLQTINKLAESKLVSYDEDYFGLESTVAGSYMAKYCVSFATMKSLMLEIPKTSSPFHVLRVISSTADVLQGVVVRRSEKKRLNDWKENLRLPVRGKVKDSKDKVIILLQMLMGDSPDSWNAEYALRSEAVRLSEPVHRICSCLVALVLDGGFKLPYESLLAVLQVCRGLQNDTFWDGPTVLRQVRGVTPAYARILSRKGISTIASLADTDRSRIDGVIASKVPVGDRILEQLRTFPKFHLQTELHRDLANTGAGIRIEANVTLSAQIGKWSQKQRKGERGFVLVGSHAIGLIDIRTFCMHDSDYHFSFDVPAQQDPHQGKWVDIYVGCDNIVGIDSKVTIRLDGGSNTSVTPVNSTTLQKSSNPSSRLSVTKGRVSKKFIQTTVSQALTRGFVNPKSTRSGREREGELLKEVNVYSFDTISNLPSRKVPQRSQPCTLVAESTAPGIAVPNSTEDHTGGMSVDAAWGESTKEFQLASGDDKDVEVDLISCIKSKQGAFEEGKTVRSETVDANSGQKSVGREYDDAFRNLF